MCECSSFLAGDATSILCPAAWHETLPAAFPPVVNKLTSAFQNQSTSPKRDFSFTTKFHKSKSQEFLISTNAASILFKTSSANTPENVTRRCQEQPVLDNSPTESKPLV